MLVYLPLLSDTVIDFGASVDPYGLLSLWPISSNLSAFENKTLDGMARGEGVEVSALRLHLKPVRAESLKAEL